MKELYKYSKSIHKIEDPDLILPIFLEQKKIKSAIDFGAGLGTWLAALEKKGIKDYVGIEHPEVDLTHYVANREKLIRCSLSEKINLGRSFDTAICLEVAEHIQSEYSDHLVEIITKHSSSVLWSAAIPGQGGINHINEQWPFYWQSKFRKKGYYFHDTIRSRIQEMPTLSCYKNNIFIIDQEPKNEWNGNNLILPSLWQSKLKEHKDEILSIDKGSRSVSFYLTIGFRGLYSKIKRKLGKKVSDNDI